MKDEQFESAWLLARTAEMGAINATIEGMIAANMEREHRGESLAYSEEAFEAQAAELRGLVVIIDEFRMNR